MLLVSSSNRPIQVQIRVLPSDLAEDGPSHVLLLALKFIASLHTRSQGLMRTFAIIHRWAAIVEGLRLGRLPPDACASLGKAHTVLHGLSEEIWLAWEGKRNRKNDSHVNQLQSCLAAHESDFEQQFTSA